MMKIIKYGTKQFDGFINSMRSKNMLKPGIEKTVRGIIENVRIKGDNALLGYTKKFDCPKMKISDLRVKSSEIIKAYGSIERSFISAVNSLIGNIKNFEKRSIQRSWIKETGGIMLGKYLRPLDRVAIYVPSGSAPYPSSLIMCAVPAKMAGVKEIVVVSAPDKKGKIDPRILLAANKLSIREIYKAGGAQAIAALAYGTRTIPRVDKIVGPGNVYVALAKKILFGQVDIDTIAGPSEVAIITDKSTDPSYVAADMLSQSEHDAMAVSICITTDKKLAVSVEKEISVQKAKLKRAKILSVSLCNQAIIITENESQSIDAANIIAPEHLEILTKNPFDMLNKIKNAGAIFLGEYSPVAIGDYAAGPSHVLPTAGTARFFSPLSIMDFMKCSNVISCNKDGFKRLLPVAKKFAEAEGFDAHLNSLIIREKNLESKSHRVKVSK